MSSLLSKRCLYLSRTARKHCRSKPKQSVSRCIALRRGCFALLQSCLTSRISITWLLVSAFVGGVNAEQMTVATDTKSAAEPLSAAVSLSPSHALQVKRVGNHADHSLHLVPANHRSEIRPAKTRSQDRFDEADRRLRVSEEAYSTIDTVTNDPVTVDTGENGLQRLSLRRLSLFEYDVGEALVVDALRSKHLDASVIALRESAILDFFQRKWRGSKSQAATMAHDFELMARYYAQHDVAYQLIERLRKQPVTLRYAADGFRTDVVGNRLAVRSVKIYFDPQRAAVLGQSHLDKAHASRQSMVSAADALLHELLHAVLVLEQGKRFVAQGGLGGGLYPLQHEMDVIEQERQLFSAMTQADKIPRPQRHSHSGYLVAASCATCLR